MAKEQNLSLNPTKISGVCGRLMCCLKYEQEHYEQTRKRMPKVGREVTTPDGTGPVTDLNIVKETVFVRLTNGDSSEIKEYPLEVIIKPTDTHGTQDAGAPKGELKTETVISENPLPKTAADTENAEKTVPSAVLQEENKPQNNRNSNPRSKNRNKNRGAALGQPVRRENPNRSPTVPEDTSGKAAKPRKNEAQAPASSPAQDKSAGSAWADALQKALDAVNKGE